MKSLIKLLVVIFVGAIPMVKAMDNNIPANGMTQLQLELKQDKARDQEKEDAELMVQAFNVFPFSESLKNMVGDYYAAEFVLIHRLAKIRAVALVQDQDGNPLLALNYLEGKEGQSTVALCNPHSLQIQKAYSFDDAIRTKYIDNTVAIDDFERKLFF